MLSHNSWLSGTQWSLDARISADFDDKVLIWWGCDYGPLTLGGQYWRVLTCLFVHADGIHLGVNMLLLWGLGKPLDRLLGRTQALVMYLLTGAASSLVSLAWHPTHLAYGSSGAIYGQGGVLIALLALAKLNLPRRQTFGILFWILLMTPFGLLFGHSSKTTNYIAHAGGLVSGLALGVLLACILRGSPLKRAIRERMALAVTAVILVVGFGGVIAMRYDVVWQYRLGLKVNAFFVAAQEEAVKRNPNDAAAHVKLANTYYWRSKYKEAANELRRALEIKPGDPDAMSLLSVSYIMMGRPGDAIPIFRENLSQGPQTWEKYLSFSDLLESTGNLNEAEEMARRAVALDNRSKSSHLQLASVLSKLHKTEEADRERKLADQLPGH